MNVSVLSWIAYLILSPVLGCLLYCLEQLYRKRILGMDVQLSPIKIIREIAVLMGSIVSAEIKSRTLLAAGYLVLSIISGIIFYSGGSMPTVILLFGLSNLCYILLRYNYAQTVDKPSLNYEIIRLTAYLSQLFILVIGFYLATGHISGKGSLNVSDVIWSNVSAVYYLPGILAGTIVIFIVFPRKSLLNNRAFCNFTDQETALLEAGRWYETVLLLGFIFLLHFDGGVLTAAIALLICLLIYYLPLLLESIIDIDRPEVVYIISVLIALISGFVNLIVLLP